MVQQTKEQMDAQIDKALKTRLEGNEAFKAGDFTLALRKYHEVLLHLKGLDGQMSSVYGPSQPRASIIEVTDEEGEAEAVASTKPVEDPESKQAQVKTALLNTYLNSAAVYIKQERWQRALDAASAAKKYDEGNAKALFREGQARIGLGEINTGKRILEDLQVKNGPDAAITAALQKLAADEKKREQAKNAQFRGMFNRKNGSGVASKEKAVEEKARTGKSAAPQEKEEEAVAASVAGETTTSAEKTADTRADSSSKV
ncbi:tetratricopeptide repeat protein 9C [Rhodotorula toruloides]|uniref:Tetratricopeptide repeat protein 9C n=1 Tax=Rhodotorula toruloides TaxID=5286 RepID=A0A511K7G9_RHOTO|nr:tetratricopeptide repeat protein 9C [Rhodotorula toruloides]